MNKIDTSGIVDPSKQQPFLGPSLEFLQLATHFGLEALGRYIAGDNYSFGVAYVLQGGRETGTTIADAYVFYNNEIYFMSGANTAAYVNVPVMIANNGNGTPDPITYTDGSTGNVHNVRAMTIADQVSGTGLADYSAFVFTQSLPAVTVGSGGTAPAFGGTWNYSTQLVKYRKNKEGLVTLEGTAQHGSASYASTIFTLPAGYRPTATRFFGVGVAGSAYVIDSLSVDSSGVVSMLGLNTPGGLVYQVHLNSVSFYAD